MSPEQFGQGLTSLNIEFSNTKMNESIKPSGNFINFRGEFTGSNSGKSSTLIIQGGDNTGAFMKSPREAANFFMTDAQRKVIMRILKSVAKSSDNAKITSSNGSLQDMVYSIYRNYCG